MGVGVGVREGLQEFSRAVSKLKLKTALRKHQLNIMLFFIFKIPI